MIEATCQDKTERMHLGIVAIVCILSQAQPQKQYSSASLILILHSPIS